MVGKCSAITKAGSPCKGNAIPGSQFCMAHDPKSRETLKEAKRRGGEGKASARRLAKHWAELGATVGLGDLAAILKSCMFAVKDGEMAPSEATAIAALARAAVAITSEVEMADRIAALETAIGNAPPLLRKVK